MLAKKTYKNQITIPKKIISKFNDVEYFDVTVRGDEIVLRPVDISQRKTKLEDVRKKIQSLGLTEEDITEAIQWARKGNK